MLSPSFPEGVFAGELGSPDLSVGVVAECVGHRDRHVHSTASCRQTGCVHLHASAGYFCALRIEPVGQEEEENNPRGHHSHGDKKAP